MVELELPGRRVDVASPRWAALRPLLACPPLRTEIGPLHRDGSRPGVVVEAEDHAVVALSWEDGIVELVRADALAARCAPAPGGGPACRRIPAREPVGTRHRGAVEVALEAVEVFTAELDRGPGEPLAEAAGATAASVVGGLERAFMPEPGVYRLDGRGALAERLDAVPPAEAPFLVLIHGTFDDTRRSFGDLFGTAEWRRLKDRYGERVLALEHHTLSQSPAANARQLVEALPEGAVVDLVSYSRGGLVGEILCRYPWTSRDLDRMFARPEDQPTVRALGRVGAAMARGLRVGRFLRVAAPAAGTILVSERLDRYLSLVLTLARRISGAGAPAVAFLEAVALAVIGARTRADQLPGLEAMRPDREGGLIPFLNLSSPRPGRLGVVAGDLEGGGLLGRAAEFFADLFHRADNDLVVDTASMFRGAPRQEGQGFARRFRGPTAHHFGYFRDPDIRGSMTDWLLDGQGGFRPMSAPTAPRATPRHGARGAPPPAEPPAQDRPVAFVIPGMTGTRLAQRGIRYWASPQQLVWGGLTRLRIDAPEVVPDGLVDRSYRDLCDALGSAFAVHRWGYDWRRPLAEAAARLAADVAAQLDRHPHPIHLVAHSTGGLVARGLVADHPQLWARLRARGGRLLMLGCPNHGSWIPVQLVARAHPLVQWLGRVDPEHDPDDLARTLAAWPGLLEGLPVQEGADLLDRVAWRGALSSWAPPADLLASARAFRSRLEARGSTPEGMVQVAGLGISTPCGLEAGGDGLVFATTPRGDGVVPCDLARLTGVPTYFVEAGHGALPSHAPSFPAYLELLSAGRTDRLPDVEPADAEPRSGAPREGPWTRSPRVFPNEEDLEVAVSGPPWSPSPSTSPRLGIEVLCADARESRHPVVVGHYEGDPLVSAEAALDAALDGRLGRDARLGRYPGPVGTVRVYRAEDGSGVAVTGLGPAGRLTRTKLEAALRAAFMELAVLDLPASGTAARPVEVATVLVGTFGGSAIAIEDSVETIVDAALGVNRKLSEQGVAGAGVARVSVVELYRDIATEAAHAARRVGGRRPREVRAAPHLRFGQAFRRSRPLSPYTSGWARRLSVTTSPKGLVFELVTDLARKEPFETDLQWPHVQGMLKGPFGTGANPRALFQYLLPAELTRQSAAMPDLVLELDPHAAQIPWELLDLHRRDAFTEPIGVRVGLLRRLEVRASADPRPPRGRRALVIGDPSSALPELPAAREEAERVAARLRARDLVVEGPLLRSGPDELMAALYRHEYDVVHIAAHGEFVGSEDRFALDAPPGRPGVVLDDGRLLTLDELRKLRAIPSLVFLNCCHLGNFTGDWRLHLGDPGRFAASIAQGLVAMGVKVVVVAGWAVVDRSARTFAETLYDELADGADLLQAVRAARKRTYRERSDPDDDSWGAFQVYGDPGFVLQWADRRGSGRAPTPRTYVAPLELREALQDLRARARGANPTTRSDLRTELTGIEATVPAAWLDQGEVRAALGEAYEALGDFDRAREHLDHATRTSEAPLRALERRLRLEVRRFDDMAEPGTDDERAERVRALAETARLLELLCRPLPTADRWTLIGEAHLRQAALLSTRRRSAKLRDAQEAFDAACREQPDPLHPARIGSLKVELARRRSVNRAAIERLRRAARMEGGARGRRGFAEAELVDGLRGRGEPSATWAHRVAAALHSSLTDGLGVDEGTRRAVAADLHLLERLLDTPRAGWLADVRARLEALERAREEASTQAR